MAAEDAPIVGDGNERVVNCANAMPIALIGADDDIDSVTGGGLRDLCYFRTGYLDRRTHKPFKPRAPLHRRHDPVPVRVAGDENFREGDETRAVGRRLLDQRTDLVDRGIRVEKNRCCLNGRGLERR